MLGYNHPEVEEAAAAQARNGMTLTGPTALSIELAERLVSLRPGAAWSILGVLRRRCCTSRGVALPCHG